MAEAPETKMNEDQLAGSRFVKDIAEAYKQHFEEQPGESIDEFLQKHTISSMDVDPLPADRPIKHLNTVQMTIDEFNAEQDKKCKEAGIDLNELRYRSYRTQHHPLKTRRDFQFKLSDQEIETLKTQGMVISGKSFEDFGNAYRTLYSNDIPVYVSSDSMLHAWHIAFDFMLEELEEKILKKAITGLLKAMMETAVNMEGTNEANGKAIDDIIHYLGVPLALMTGTGVTKLEELYGTEISAKIANILPRIQGTLACVASLSPAAVALFGEKPRELDFSQFTPRGHYTKTPGLTNYFKGMIWLGRSEFELDAFHPSDIMAAFVLEHVYRTTAKADIVVEQVSSLITNFIGVTDSMTFPELSGFMKTCEMSFETYNHEEHSERFLNLLNEMDVGTQLINSQVRDVSDGVIPRAVTFLGQRFTLDAWAMCKTVYPDVPDTDPTQVRRVPSGVDVAYSVFGNDTAAPILVDRMNGSNDDRVPFRDGVNYSSNLTAVRKLMDGVPEEFYRSSIYGMWIRTLRSLSNDQPRPSPTVGSNPRAWNLKSMNSQLASWAQLRHDTILYVKQGYTSMTCCEFPDAMIEPNPQFWASMTELVTQTCNLIDSVGYPEILIEVADAKNDEDEKKPDDPYSMHSFMRRRHGRGGYTQTPKQIQDGHVGFLKRFSETMVRLNGLCEKQCNGEALSEEDMTWLNTICVLHQTFGSGASRNWRGWYCELFYNSNDNVEQVPTLVADVHTDPPSEHGNPGVIVHEGVGKVRLCYTIGLDGQGNETVFVGPIMTYYEHLAPYPQRLDDDAWKKLVQDGTPQSPAWLNGLISPEEVVDDGRQGKRRGWR